jgi:hypothetical protein
MNQLCERFDLGRDIGLHTHRQFPGAPHVCWDGRMGFLC